MGWPPSKCECLGWLRAQLRRQMFAHRTKLHMLSPTCAQTCPSCAMLGSSRAQVGPKLEPTGPSSAQVTFFPLYPLGAGGSRREATRISPEKWYKHCTCINPPKLVAYSRVQVWFPRITQRLKMLPSARLQTIASSLSPEISCSLSRSTVKMGLLCPRSSSNIRQSWVRSHTFT